MIASQQRQQKHFFIFTGIVLIFAMSGIFNLHGNTQAEYPGGGSVYSILSALFQAPQETFHQYKADGVTEVSKDGTVTAGTVVLGVSFSSNIRIVCI